MEIVKGRRYRPRRVMLVGQHGVGKSTWAAGAPKPLFLDFEGGICDLDVASISIREHREIIPAINFVLEGPTEYQTLVIDTIDWLEKLIHGRVADEHHVKTIADVKYGRGYPQALAKWSALLAQLEGIQYKHGCIVILLAHAAIEKFESPEVDSYDRYEPAIRKDASRMLQEWCDEVLFAQFKIFSRKTDEGFGRERTLVSGGRDRVIKTSEAAFVAAKNRLKLPPELPMEWAAYAEFLPQPGNVQGMIVNGSSKKKEVVNG